METVYRKNKMKLSVPTNWDIGLIEKIKTDNVDEIYAKLAKDAIGGGRVSFILPQISKKKAADYIKLAHKHGLKFNYLLNSTCLGNIEWSRSGQRDIRKLLDWLCAARVDALTVSMPYLLQLIKKRYPHFKVYISTQAGVSSLKEARYWQDLGADRITLSVHKANRDFKLLKIIRKHLKCEIQLIANLHCLKNCPFWLYHGTSSSHDSQTGAFGNRFIIDYSFIMCSYIRLKDPAEFIRSGWIRPEDTHFYEEAGIDRFKLVNRTMPTYAITRVVDAYVNRRYDGNLLDLFSDPGRTFIMHRPNLLYKIRYFLHPFAVNLFRLIKAKQLIRQPDIYINNRSLDGFLEYFLKEDSCGIQPCSVCKHCEDTARKAIRTPDRSALVDLTNKYEKFLEGLVSGKIFSYK